MCCFNYRLTVVGLSISLLTVCMACQTPSGSQVPGLSLPKSTVKIGNLRQPQQVEQSVSLAGLVTQRLAIVNGWLYQIDDSTGKIWVLTQQAAPAVGQQVYVDGTLHYEAIPMNGADVGDYYLEEKQQ